MRALKVLVVLMTALIIAGVVGIVVVIAGRLAASGKPRPLATTDGPVVVALPPAGRVTGMTGVGERLVLHVERPGAADMLLMIDPASGAVLRTIELSPTDKPPQ
ncbi:MAG TPA: DUF6476 family protein [Stellaceae bacterium]|nr:DUF6476 family protein [Stellaceae bacterium]